MDLPDFYSNLSDSTRAAVSWAGAWSLMRTSGSPNQAQQSSAANYNIEAQVSAADLLVGMLRAHPNDAEPLQLVQHFGIPPQRLYEALAYSPGSLSAATPPGLPDHSQLDPNAQKILSDAASMAGALNRREKGRVRMRDLFGAILGFPSDAQQPLESALSGAPVPMSEIWASYQEFLKDAAWKDYAAFLAARYPFEKPVQQANLRTPVAGFSTDTTPKEELDNDLVWIGAEVEAFAYLIAATDLRPPLAIGLFGDWGAGKSYFMQALKRRVAKITQDVQNAGPQSSLSVFKSVVQIEFNAWNYVEGELWASLVNHIFNNLTFRDDENLSSLEERRNTVIKQIATLRGQAAGQVAEHEALKQELSEKQDSINRLKDERDKALEKLNDVRDEDVAAAIKLAPEQKQELNANLRKLGINQTLENAADLSAALVELRATATRASGLGMLMRQRGWRWTLGLVAVLLSAPVLSVLIAWLGQDRVPALTNALLSLSGLLSLLTVMVRAANSQLTAAVVKFEQAQQALDARRREVEQTYQARLGQRQEEYDRVNARYQQALQEEQDLNQKIAELEKDLATITPGRVLVDFINERAGSQDYRRLLGVPALIRRDLTILSRDIERWNDQLLKAKTETEVAAIQAEQQGNENKPLFNRIVLYIDDLDRCPPSRVVQVLQAVHLLMAFPLFVVVVAVDARWLSQSLQKHYAGLLVSADPTGQPALDGGPQATPQDYLEKIFQVPFWVQPLTDNARLRIVTGLVEKSLAVEPAKGEQAPPVPEPTQPVANATIKGKVTQAPAEQDRMARRLQSDVQTDPNPPGLNILSRELDFMGAVKSLLGQTPRSVKRYVNVYRLYKTMAMSQYPDFTADTWDADFKQVLLLLAVLTGLPAISTDFFELLHRLEPLEEETPSSPRTPYSFQQVLNDLEVRVCGPAGTTPASAYQGREQAVEQFKRLSRWAQSYDGGSWLALDANKLALWARQATRFSFHEPS